MDLSRFYFSFFFVRARKISVCVVTIVRLKTGRRDAFSRRGILVFHRPAKNSRWSEDTAREGVPVFSSTHPPSPTSVRAVAVHRRGRRREMRCSAFSQPRCERSPSDAPDASLLFEAAKVGNRRGAARRSSQVGHRVKE